MLEREKVVARFKNGQMRKGIVQDYNPEASEIVIEDEESLEEHRIVIEDLKAIFFVHSLAGDREHRERNVFGISKNLGHKLYVKFQDGESMLGFIRGDVPWGKGFYRSKLGIQSKGFFMTPVDSESNNIKFFVIGSAIQDITIIVA